MRVHALYIQTNVCVYILCPYMCNTLLYPMVYICCSTHCVAVKYKGRYLFNGFFRLSYFGTYHAGSVPIMYWRNYTTRQDFLMYDGPLDADLTVEVWHILCDENKGYIPAVKVARDVFVCVLVSTEAVIVQPSSVSTTHAQHIVHAVFCVHIFVSCMPTT